MRNGFVSGVFPGRLNERPAFADAMTFGCGRLTCP
jgi:hypothetical protein